MKLPKKKTVIKLAALLVIAVFLYWRYYPSLRNWGDPEIVETLGNARSVEVYRVASETDESAKQTIGGYPILATGDKQDIEFAERLSEVLLSHGVHINLKKCGMYPGVAFRISDGKRAVDVLVCFECDVLACVKEGAEVTSADYQDFDSVRETLMALAKESLPQDDNIQQLPADNNADDSTNDEAAAE